MEYTHSFLKLQGNETQSSNIELIEKSANEKIY